MNVQDGLDRGKRLILNEFVPWMLDGMPFRVPQLCIPINETF